MQRRELLQGALILLGGTLSESCTRAVEVPIADRTIKTRALTTGQQGIAHRCADLIIPDTDTPGALAAGVGDFIDYVVASWYQADERASFIQGLDALEAESVRRFSASFTKLEASHQVQLLEELSAVAERDAESSWDQGGAEMFLQIKELTVTGFYTSELGSTVEREYVPMPGRYDGFFKFNVVGKLWAR